MGSLQVGGVGVSNAAAESDHVFMPAFPLCRDLPAFLANAENVSDGERCSKYHRLQSADSWHFHGLLCSWHMCWIQIHGK